MRKPIEIAPKHPMKMNGDVMKSVHFSKKFIPPTLQSKENNSMLKFVVEVISENAKNNAGHCRRNVIITLVICRKLNPIATLATGFVSLDVPITIKVITNASKNMKKANRKPDAGLLHFLQ